MGLSHLTHLALNPSIDLSVEPSKMIVAYTSTQVHSHSATVSFLGVGFPSQVQITMSISQPPPYTLYCPFHTFLNEVVYSVRSLFMLKIMDSIYEIPEHHEVTIFHLILVFQ